VTVCTLAPGAPAPADWPRGWRQGAATAIWPAAAAVKMERLGTGRTARDEEKILHGNALRLLSKLMLDVAAT